MLYSNAQVLPRLRHTWQKRKSGRAGSSAEGDGFEEKFPGLGGKELFIAIRKNAMPWHKSCTRIFKSALRKSTTIENGQKKTFFKGSSEHLRGAKKTKGEEEGNDERHPDAV